MPESSIADEITRLSGCRNDILSAISSKGVTVPADSVLSSCPALIGSIQTGGGGGSTNLFSIGLTGSATASSETYMELEQMQIPVYTYGSSNLGSSKSSNASVGRPLTSNLAWSALSAYSGIYNLALTAKFQTTGPDMNIPEDISSNGLGLLFYINSANMASGSASAIQRVGVSGLSLDSAYLVSDSSNLLALSSLVWSPEPPNGGYSIKVSLFSPTYNMFMSAYALSGTFFNLAYPAYLSSQINGYSYPYPDAPASITGTATCSVVATDYLTTGVDSAAVRNTAYTASASFNGNVSSTNDSDTSMSLSPSLMSIATSHMQEYNTTYTTAAPNSAYNVTYSSFLNSASGQTGVIG